MNNIIIVLIVFCFIILISCTEDEASCDEYSFKQNDNPVYIVEDLKIIVCSCDEDRKAYLIENSNYSENISEEDSKSFFNGSFIGSSLDGNSLASKSKSSYDCDSVKDKYESNNSYFKEMKEEIMIISPSETDTIDPKNVKIVWNEIEGALSYQIYISDTFVGSIDASDSETNSYEIDVTNYIDYDNMFSIVIRAKNNFQYFPCYSTYYFETE